MKTLYSKPGHLIRRCQQIAVAIFLEEAAGFDITPLQYAAMVAIRENPGIAATRVCELVAFDRSTLGNVLERLEKKGYIVRTPSPDDKRVRYLELSAAGKAALKQAEPAVTRAQTRILKPLPPRERREFMRLMTKLVHLNNGSSRVPLKSDRSA